MLAQTVVTSLSIAEYLQQEQCSKTRYEYVDGHIFAMAGGSRAHNQISGNLYMAFRSHLRGKPCEVYIADMKVSAENCFYYPDVVVTCQTHQETADLYLTQPCLIAEVLSPSTEHIDKREKLLAYQNIKSLESYLIIAQDRPWIEHYQRVAEKTWSLTTYAEQAVIALPCINLEMKFSEIYEDVLNLKLPL